MGYANNAIIQLAFAIIHFMTDHQIFSLNFMFFINTSIQLLENNPN